MPCPLIYAHNTFPTNRLANTEDCTVCPDYTLVVALTLLSERSPIIKDPRIVFREQIECIRGSDAL